MMAGQREPAPREAPVDELIAEISTGNYTPRPGTSGQVLLQAHPSEDPYTAGRSLAIFAKLALRYQGLWWPMAIEADPDRLTDAESAYMAAAWKQWCAGRNPFRRGARRVTP